MKDANALEEAIFSDAIALPLAERNGFVERRCGSDPDSVERVMALLEAYEKYSDYLEMSPATGVCCDARNAEVKLPPEHAPGDRIGRYHLLERIGEGGFGVVYLAEQEEPVRRRVALKIIRLGMDTREFIARFEAERQAMALMDHPNIARVFDAGATNTGRPYLVMELIRGTPITRYCDENSLSFPARLELFSRVCSAIQHAHQKGVIHRDLKPSNILVALEDGTPIPKVIDFGIAKATRDPLTDKTLSTHIHALIGTPAYTSPEQLEMGARDVDTRSDIYSLGVLLYELLSGCQPFDRAAFQRASYDEMRRTIREVEPPRPSARVNALSDEARTVIAAARGVDSAKLSALLQSDLDWIVMRCLEKDRTLRYETANALALDIRRHLENEPVVARPPSRAYRVRKFLRRHRTGATAAAAIVMSLVGGLIASAILLARATEAERAEGDLRRQAEHARESETLRASRTARDLAGQFFSQGKTAEGLAYLVHAARKDPSNPTYAPRLASAIAAHNFLLPVSAPMTFPSHVAYLGYFDNGRKIAAYCEDGTIGFIDTAAGQQVRTKLPVGLSRADIAGVMFAGRVMLVRCQDNVIRVLDPGTGRIEREFKFEKTILRIDARNDDRPMFVVHLDDWSVIVADALDGHTLTMPFKHSPAAQMEISADGRWMMRYEDPVREWRLWDLKTGECRAARTLPGSLLRGVISRGGPHLVTAYAAEGTLAGLQLWSLPDGEPLGEPQFIDLHSQPVIVPTFSPDGRTYGVSTLAGHQFYTTATGSKLGPLLPFGRMGPGLPADRNRLRSAVANNGVSREFTTGLFCGPSERPQFIAQRGSGERYELAVLDIASGQPVVPPMLHDAGVADVRMSDDGSTLLTITGDGVLRLWDLRTGQLRAQPGMQLATRSVVAISPDGSEVVTSGVDGIVYRLRIGRGAARPLVLPRTDPLMPAPFLTESPARLWWLKRDRAVVLDVASGAEVAGGFPFPEPITTLVDGQGALRPDLRCMVVHTAAGAWQAWEADATGIRKVVTLENAPDGASDVLLGVGGDYVAMIPKHRPQTVRFWNVHTGRSVGLTAQHPASLRRLDNTRPACFSSDGRRFVAGDSSGVVKIWDPATGESLMQLGPLRRTPILGLDFNHNATRIVTRNNWSEAQLWDASSGQPASPVLADGGHIRGAAFSAAGEFLLTWATNGVARVWDGYTGARIGDSMRHPGSEIRAAAFAADGRRVVTASDDRTARVWDAATGQPVTEPMRHEDCLRVLNCAISPDGRFVQTEPGSLPGAAHTYSLWSVPPGTVTAPVPEWLLQLATLLATKTVNDAAQCVDVPDVLAQLDDVRRQLAALPGDAPFVEWGRWVLNDRNDRPIAPGFTITPEQADKLAKDLATVSVRARNGE